MTELYPPTRKELAAHQEQVNSIVSHIQTPYFYSSTANLVPTATGCALDSFETEPEEGGTGRWLTTRQGIGPGPQSGDLVTITYDRAIQMNISNPAYAYFTLALPFTAASTLTFFGAVLDFSQSSEQPDFGASAFIKTATPSTIGLFAAGAGAVDIILLQNVLIRYLAA